MLIGIWTTHDIKSLSMRDSDRAYYIVKLYFDLMFYDVDPYEIHPGWLCQPFMKGKFIDTLKEAGYIKEPEYDGIDIYK